MTQLWKRIASQFRRLRFWRRDEEFVDLSFPIAAHELVDGADHVVVAADVDGNSVGFKVELAATWEPWHLEEHGLTLWRGGVSYLSVGGESDAFVRTLAEAYGLKKLAKAMLPRVQFAAVALNGNPLETIGTGTRIKCFFESDRDDRYAEFYTNISLADSRLEFHEKDTDYRKPLLRALTTADSAGSR